MNKEEINQLFAAAFAARTKAYAPYSHVSVGAALMSLDGKIFSGCNIENAAFSTSICAERVAVAQAVAAGYKQFKAIAICGGAIEKGADDVSFFPPCGVCRQVLTEFCPPDFPLFIAVGENNYQELTLADSLPQSFSGNNLI